ncbi:KH domain-containing protein At4g18375-like [Pistacia vera]|uniref:KH domain-containing protein At4g18375-like n=1 Tax=Pistacia vera TaxID=55513 RepID=UPI0012633274|nr:KH domain-containing protein At4g18375-like [Pistacia vera]
MKAPGGFSHVLTKWWDANAIDDIRPAEEISGKPDVAKRALYEVSTLLHQNPRKDKPPTNFPVPYGGQSFHPPGPPTTSVHSPGKSMWPPRNSSSHGMPPMPWMGGYGNQPSGFGSGGFNDVPPGHRGETSAEFSMKILCSAGKIGGVIGKGGFNVKQLQQETGTSIHVEDASTDSDERVIRVSAIEGLWNPRSQTIDAILQLQNKAGEFSERGTIVTRLLVPSSKVGCILGQGGHVINEMRRRTQADIRVYSKDDKPKCASEDEELVQISGNFAVAKDALAEIGSRLRVRTLRDVGAEPVPVGPVQRFGSAGSLPGRGPPLSGTMRAGSSGGYDSLRGGRDYEPQSYPVPPPATGYPNMNSGLETRIHNNTIGYIMETGGSSISNVGEVAGARIKLQDPQSGGSECVVDIRGSSEHLAAAQSILKSYMTSSGPNMSAQQAPYQSMDSQQNSYQNMSAQPSSYQNMNVHQNSYHSTAAQQSSFHDMNNALPLSSYHNMNAQQRSYNNMNSQQSPYQGINAQHSPYRNINAHQSPYSTTNAQQGAYHNINAPPSAYHNISGQQGTYQY